VSALLERIGIDGEILHTPDHSDESVSLLPDDGAVLVGDLTPPVMIGGEDADVARATGSC
jgi:glyoxylase-like metal-dependent hydrolase (beta-lactamase superfamily II)